MQIRLQTTVTPFDDSFVKFLPVVEKAMIDHGLNPRDFIIAKDSAQFNSYPGLIPTAAAFDSFWDSQIGEVLIRCLLLREEQHRWVERLGSYGLI
jgi:hypothetical protein